MIVAGGGRRKLRSIVEIIPLALISAAAYIIPWRLTALYLGPELPSMTEAVIGEMTSVGSLLIMGLGLNMLGLTKLKVINYIPACFLPILFCLFIK